MSDISRQGRTVLFVSHNMNAVQTLCSRTIALSEGRIVADGDPNSIIAWYVQQQSSEISAKYDLSSAPRSAEKLPLIRAVRLKTCRGELTSQIFCGDPLWLELDLHLPRRFEVPQIGIGVDDSLGQRVFSVATHLSSTPLGPASGDLTVSCRIDELALAPGRFTLSLSAGNKQSPLIDEVQGVVGFVVVESDFYQNGQTPSAKLGQMLVRSRWNLAR